MLIVEVKKYDPEAGMQVLHYLELESDGAAADFSDFVVRHVASEGANRTRAPQETVVRGHVKSHGVLDLIRRAISELKAKPIERGTIAA